MWYIIVTSRTYSTAESAVTVLAPMKKIVVMVTSLSLALATAVWVIEVKTSVEGNLTSMPLPSTENRGQCDKQVKFRAAAGGATMWIAADRPLYWRVYERIDANSELAPPA